MLYASNANQVYLLMPQCNHNTYEYLTAVLVSLNIDSIPLLNSFAHYQMM